MNLSPHNPPRWPLARRASLSLAAVLAAVLAGCASSAGIAPSAQPLDPARVGLPGAATPPAPLSIPSARWTAFGDPQLDALVAQALAEHPSLRLAQARLARAGAALAGAQAAEGPQLNGSADVTRQRFSATSIYPPPLGGSTRTLGTLQLGGSWEVDFFGRHRAAIEAAVGSQRAAEADAAAARTALATSVARGYLLLGRLQAQRGVAERTLQQRQQLLQLVGQRVRNGLDTQVELRQGEGALPDARQQIEQIDEQIALARNALAALTAQPASALATLAVALDAVRALALPSALPADMLARRADITAARWRVEAAGSDVAVARAQFYPNVNLTAFVGLSSIGLDRLLRAGSEQAGVGPALHLPLFDAGRLRANLAGRTAELDAAVESYNTAVIDAIHDAADQLAMLQSVARQQAEQQQAQAAAEAAHALALQRFEAGLSSYLTVLNAETALLNQRRQAVDLQARALDAQVTLLRAIGGSATPADDAALPRTRTASTSTRP
jgi:NodT family efflux transporter outer membrane factor (OMF) lipoprotein